MKKSSWKFNIKLDSWILCLKFRYLSGLFSIERLVVYFYNSVLYFLLHKIFLSSHFHLKNIYNKFLSIWLNHSISFIFVILFLGHTICLLKLYKNLTNWFIIFILNLFNLYFVFCLQHQSLSDIFIFEIGGYD